MTARKPRLFSFGRETELANLDAWVDDAEQRALLVRVVDAFIEISRTRKLEDENLAPIAEAAAHPADTVRALALSRLVVMAHYFDEARSTLAELAEHPSAPVRQFVASSLVNAPETSRDTLLPTLLADNEPTVREAARSVAATS